MRHVALISQDTSLHPVCLFVIAVVVVASSVKALVNYFSSAIDKLC